MDYIENYRCDRTGPNCRRSDDLDMIGDIMDDYRNDYDGADDLDVMYTLDTYIEDFCSKNRINPGEMKTSQFTSALLYIYRTLYKPAVSQVNNRTCVLDYETEDGLNELCRVADAYIFIALKYNKMPTSYGFQCLTGVTMDTLTRWYNGGQLLRNSGNITKLRYDLSKRIFECSREYVRGALADTNIGLITLANNDSMIGLEYNKHQLQQAAELLPSESAALIASRRRLLSTDKAPEKPL